MFERIKANYLKNWVTEAQLDRYVLLGALTQAQADEIRQVKIEKGGV